jgi:methionyl-tRNA formyltransferase
MNADLFVVVAFGQILKKRALEIPRLYAINVHGSLLPKYRGAAPTNWAIINGERVSGVTVIKMNEKMDEGDIILKKEMPIDAEDTNITLTEKLSDLGADALIEAVDMIDAGKAVPVKQDPSAATYAPKLGKEDGLIDWNEPAVKIHNKVRALLPWPGAYTRFDKKILKILKTEVMGSTANGRAKNGEFLSVTKGRGMVVRTGDKDILVQRVQIEGKKPMDSEAFLRGHSLRVGYVFN